MANLKNDLPAGLVVFLVALPLCLGIALASGAPLLSGIIAGVVGGIVVGFLSNSQISVSGPAAGLTAIVLAAITHLGNFEIFLSAVILAGGMQLILGFLSAGSIANYFPGSVIKGMLSAIGIIIIMKQIPHAFGYDKDTEGDFSFMQADGENTFTALLHPLNHIDAGATIIAMVSISLIILWERPFMKRVAFIPGALMAVLAGVLLNLLFKAVNPALELSGMHLVSIPIAASVSDFIQSMAFPNFSKIADKEIWITAATIAAVASVETLLCIEAIDKLDPLKRVTSVNRELKAQGVGNILSGFLGGIPITSVIVRGSANVNSGGRTKTSTIFHGLLLLISVLAIPNLLNSIPLASLAAILIMTGYKLAKISIFKETFKDGKYQWVPFIVTVIAVVFTDLLKGVGIGLAVSIIALIRGNIKTSFFIDKEVEGNDELIHIELSQEVSFLNKASIKLMLDEIPENKFVWLDATHTQYIDMDVLELIREFKDIKAPDRNIELCLTGFRDEYEISNNADTISDRMKELIKNLKPKLTKEVLPPELNLSL